MNGSVVRSWAALAVLGVLARVGGAADLQPDRVYDVLVYGATPAGISAAVAASREGASVLLAEPGGHPGGMVAGGLSRTDTGNTRTIGGIALEFFDRCSAKYGGRERWHFEPHVYQQVLDEMVREAGFPIVTGRRLRGVGREGGRIVSVELEGGLICRANAFIDATYEGDLMAAAGVSYVVGREGTAQYGEELAGFRPIELRPRTAEVMAQGCPDVGQDGPHYIHGTPIAIPARDPATRRPLWGVNESHEAPGAADKLTQSYTFRLCVTQRKEDLVPFPKPRRYEPQRYELLLELIRSYPRVAFTRLVHVGALPNGKFDLNAQGLFSTDYAGGSFAYPDGDDATRRRVWQDHVDYEQGFLWFLGHDGRVPGELRKEVNSWGLAKEEFTDNEHWPYQLYVREGRRMVGAYVMTEGDVRKNITKADSVAMGSFVIDCHIVQRIVTADGDVADEGSFPDVPLRPYQVPYRCVTPKRADCANLLVPVCVSASHVAYCTLRMEPVYMALGHACGVAAAAAAREGKAVQDVNVAALQSKLRGQKQVLALDSPKGTRSAELPGVVVDDDQAQLGGKWVVGTAGPAVDGAYRHDGNDGKGGKVARYRAAVPADGRYEVRFSYAPFPNRATNVPVTIEHADGVATVRVNERRKPMIDGLFASLGTYRFVAGKAAVVTIGTEGTDGYVAIDAVQLLRVGD